MLDNPIRVAWVDTLWRELRSEFKQTFGHLPENVCATVGYPPTRARGKRGERCSAYVGKEWTGNNDEGLFVSIHPEQMRSGATAAKALVDAMGRAAYGTRRWRNWGHEYASNKQIAAVVERVGEPPAGYAKMDEPKVRGGSRLRKFECDCYRPVIARVAADAFNATCDKCKQQFKKVA